MWVIAREVKKAAVVKAAKAALGRALASMWKERQGRVVSAGYCRAAGEGQPTKVPTKCCVGSASGRLRGTDPRVPRAAKLEKYGRP